MNVQDSDATLILDIGALEGGAQLTVEAANRLQKPCLVVQLDSPDPMDAAESVIRWLSAGGYRVLNIAGPRESRRPGVNQAALAFLRLVGSKAGAADHGKRI